MKAGTTVRLIQPVIQGQVIERRFNAADEVEVLVDYPGADGEPVQRWFLATQLEEVTP
jgi:hypothetical protein